MNPNYSSNVISNGNSKTSQITQEIKEDLNLDTLEYDNSDIKKHADPHQTIKFLETKDSKKHKKIFRIDQDKENISSASSSLSFSESNSSQIAELSNFVLKKPDYESELKTIEDNLNKNSTKLHKYLKNYYLTQHSINDNRRVILIDWMNEFCNLLEFNKKTCYESVLLMDLYFSRSKITIPKDKLQLIGLTCLLIAGKNEEVHLPDIENFARATDYSYSIQEIFTMEQHILTTLNFKPFYPTYYDWGNYITLKWDYIMDILSNSQEGGQSSLQKFKKFRNDSELGDMILIRFYEILDIVLFDFEAEFYSEKSLCLAIIYYLMGMCNDVFDFNFIAHHFIQAEESTYIDSHNLNIQIIINYNSWFINVCNLFFGISQDELKEYLKFASLYFTMKFNETDALKDFYSKLNAIDKTKEEIIQIQLYNPSNKISIVNILNSRKKLYNKVN